MTKWTTTQSLILGVLLRDLCRAVTPNHKVLVVLPEHVARVQGGEPVAVRVSVVVAGSPAVTLDEGNLPEVFQTGSRWDQGLTWTLRPHSCFLETNIQVNDRHRSFSTVSHGKWFKKSKPKTVPTITKEYPNQRRSQPDGQSGRAVVWLWTAMMLALASHTVHLWQYTQYSWNYTVHSTPVIVHTVHLRLEKQM